MPYHLEIEKGIVVRILLLSNLYPPYVEGGAEILAGDIAAGLERLGHEVIVLTSSYRLSRPEQDGQIWRSSQPLVGCHPERCMSYQPRDPFCFRTS